MVDNLNLDIQSAYHPVSLRYRNRAEITGLLCEQKPYPRWF